VSAPLPAREDGVVGVDWQHAWKEMGALDRVWIAEEERERQTCMHAPVPTQTTANTEAQMLTT